jgi:hypothetical protein
VEESMMEKEGRREHPLARYKTIGIFAGKTILYMLILILLIYLYHYRQVGGGAFIYNEF